MSSLRPRAIQWFEERRGIKQETLEAFGVYSLADDKTAFPYPEGATKVRVGWDKIEGDPDSRKYVWDPPGKAGQVPFLPPDFGPSPGQWMFLTEGETDTMALWQNAPEKARTGIVGLSGLNAWKEHYAEELFGEAKYVFLLFDNDDPYKKPHAAEANKAARAEIKRQLGRKLRTVRLPQGIDDVAEFFQQYDWAAFEELLKRAAKPVRHYKRLDLDAPVPDTDWLVEGLLVAGELTLFAGEPGVGKSLITTSLGLAVAGGDDKFLGFQVKKHGSVILIDEENPGDLVVQRLHALGLQDRHKPYLEYLWRAGVDLREEAHLLLEEALDLEPTLIVIDSLSAVTAGMKQNDESEVNPVMRKNILPIARDSGASIVLLHHTTRDGERYRGSGEIGAAADQILQVKARAGGVIEGVNVFPAKNRRLTQHVSLRFVGDMDKDGFIRLENLNADSEEAAW